MEEEKGLNEREDRWIKEERTSGWRRLGFLGGERGGGGRRSGGKESDTCVTVYRGMVTGYK